MTWNQSTFNFFYTDSYSKSDFYVIIKKVMFNFYYCKLFIVNLRHIYSQIFKLICIQIPFATPAKFSTLKLYEK